MCRLALASLNKHSEAVGYYQKALELDPHNDTYKTNLKIAEEKMETCSPVRPVQNPSHPRSAHVVMSSSVCVCVCATTRQHPWAAWTWRVCSVIQAS